MAKIAHAEDTIAAVVTAAGAGAVGIVRVSGQEAVAIVDKVFKSKSGKPLGRLRSFSLCYGWIVRGGAGREVVDEVLVSVMRAPRSYTREDVVEISCHGGSRALGNVLELVLNNGARFAGPGEFTKRAFLNGRIDLAQAEAVLDVIQAKSERALKNSLSQLSGAVSRCVASLRQLCLELLAETEAEIDFPEEEAGPPPAGRLLSRVMELTGRLDELIGRSTRGRIIREGLKVVIYGKPNVGKSSLLNALLRQERAIVTSVPGTTRDTIEEGISIKGLAVRLVDTAGVLEHNGEVEREALLRTERALKEADLVLFVVDGSAPLTSQDEALAQAVIGKAAVLVVNKGDLRRVADPGRVEKLLMAPVVEVSALEGKNIGQLEEKVFDCVFDHAVPGDEDVLVSNARHIDIFNKTREHLYRARSSLEQNLSYEFAATDMRCAAETLGELTGEVLPEDVLDAIFSKFCIGK